MRRSAARTPPLRQSQRRAVADAPLWWTGTCRCGRAVLAARCVGWVDHARRDGGRVGGEGDGPTPRVAMVDDGGGRGRDRSHPSGLVATVAAWL